MPEIGFLCSGSKSEFAHLLTAFRGGVKSKGYKIVGSAPKGTKEVRIRTEWADGDYSKLFGKAKSLIDRGLQVLAATGGIISAREAEKYSASVGSQVPILFIGGRVLPKPAEHSAQAKGMHLATSRTRVEDHNRHHRLRELLGENATICELVNKKSIVNDVESGWAKSVSAGTVAELDSAFKTAANVHKADGLLVSADPFFHRRRSEIVRLAKKYKIAACYPWREYVEAGGLMSHGPSLANAYRRLGIWAGMLLDGAKLAELPDTDPGYREFILNLKTAKALGRVIPDALLLRADALIQ